MNFYSQYGEDEWIANNVTLPEKGLYLDVGCGHPTEHSNTAFLRDGGWEGLAIDGNADWGKDWVGIDRGTFINAVIAEKESLVRFKVYDCPHYSKIEPGTPTHQAIPLSRFNSNFDFLSLDLEGGEYDAILGMKKLPRIIVSEYNSAVTGEDFRVRNYLLDRGYAMLHSTLANMIFLNENCS